MLDIWFNWMICSLYKPNTTAPERGIRKQGIHPPQRSGDRRGIQPTTKKGHSELLSGRPSQFQRFTSRLGNDHEHMRCRISKYLPFQALQTLCNASPPASHCYMIDG
uniref:Uncharacterized protein n=1 Tax=Oryza brachyantha TaxID=4533 RepID=J3MC17_ORYBR